MLPCRLSARLKPRPHGHWIIAHRATLLLALHSCPVPVLFKSGVTGAGVPRTGRVRTALVAVEAMRALKVACDNTKLTRKQIEDIFYGNAARLYGLPV